MAEYVLQPGDEPADVARSLLERAGSPDGVHWSPRPDVPGGGVFVVTDDEVAAAVAKDRHESRRIEAERIEAAQKAADERDAKADETGLTPLELGFPANAGTDPGSAGEAERNAEATSTPAESDDDADADDEPATDDPETPENEAAMTPADRRAARRAKAATKAAAEKPATEEGK